MIVRELVIVITPKGTIMVHGDDMDVELVEEMEALLGTERPMDLITDHLHLCG